MAKKLTAKTLTNKIIKPFDGEDDISAWLAKVDLVAKLTKTDDLGHLYPCIWRVERWPCIWKWMTRIS